MLTLAVFVRELPSRLVDGFDSMYGAPQWVVVERSDDVGGSWRVSAGREYGAGTHLLGVMRADAETMTPEAFDAQWHRR